MEEILKDIEYIEDIRQQAKVRHKLLDIIVIVLFAKLANADDWEEMEAFAECHEEFLKRYICLENGIPSHDTLQRVMGSIDPQYMQKLYEKWNALLSTEEGEKLKKIICIDGKTMRGNGSRNQKPNHIVSAWSDEDGFCLGQYYQCDKIKWMKEKDRWKGIKSIGMVCKTTTDGERTVTEKRYYISSLPLDIELLARAIRQHWSVEIMHWHLDVTFKEDANTTQDKTAAQNLNIIHKWSLSILRLLQIGNKKLSLRKKRFYISMKAEEYLDQIIKL